MCAGFYFIPGALSIDEQCRWIRESLTSFPQPPNRTNHNALYGPIRDLFFASKEGKILTEVEPLSETNCTGVDVMEGNTPRWKISAEPYITSGSDTSKSVSASVLLRKLRWSTLGLQFDWSKVLFISFLYQSSCFIQRHLHVYFLKLCLFCVI